MTKRNRVVWCDRGWQPIWFGFCPNAKAWRRALRNMDVDPADHPYPDSDGRMTSFEKNGKVRCIVTIRDGVEHRHDPIEIMGILVHEATHIWQEVRAAMQERAPSSEFEAYSMQAITQELFSAYARTTGKD